ncbi:FAD dependent oxidoreductase [Punctularia strigosozonata HHB-11173 SS5]|uniref:FAD dependent oxidoreductase n=1 Tax=Punctularia strigosozonata (strain HHB-11173) TaxID=741275 RepID=UPI00044179A9|nr:FAD dependent oxidoreductase [Punctularia strigosozonata HHB-11173 SS5]EIN13895.1 FAD dependent oxidoreductase [Punctularia strigosozonata HHB-11173 SS5]
MAEDQVAAGIIILGAGVIGLTIAHVLSENEDIARRLTIVARDMPEDLDSQAFASPWAGANWSPIGGFNERIHGWETLSFNKFWDMIPSGLVRELPSKVLYTSESMLSNIWYKDLVRKFRVLDSSELPSGTSPAIVAGVAFSTISVDPQTYLPWLKAELVKRGVTFVRKKISSLGEATSYAGPGGVLINASGLGARSLFGVEDLALHPIRGQTIIVHSPKAWNECLMVMGDQPSPTGESTYIIPRTTPGVVLLGGTFQPHNWDVSVDLTIAGGIWERCAALQPYLKDSETRILSHNVGLRPARTGGPRVETTWVELGRSRNRSSLTPWYVTEGSAEGKVLVIHAYGFGPAGYQNSWGAAYEVAKLLSEASKQK